MFEKRQKAMVSRPFHPTNWKNTLRHLLRSRWVFSAVAALIVLVLVVRALLPLLISTAAVRSSMEEALSAWTGAPATISGEPEIGFWPDPTISLHGVRIRDTETPSEVLAQAATVTAEFDILAALRGEPVFYDFKLDRPVIRIERQADGRLNWKPGGRLGEAIAATSQADGTATADDALGTITIKAGTLLISDEGSGSTYEIDGIDGTVGWPALNQPLNASLSGNVNGERLTWTFSSSEPLRLFSENNANVRLSIASAPLTANFDGVANLSVNGFAAGALSASTPSLSSLFAWYGADTAFAADPGSAGIEANISTTGSTIKLDGVSLEMQNTTGKGVLDIALPRDAQPRISGTLALNELDFRSFLSSEAPLQIDGEDIQTFIETDFLQKLRLDLRLSLDRAAFGRFQLTEMAAGLLVENGRASLNIGNSVFADGSLSGRVAVSEEGFEGGAELQLSLKNADFGSAVKTLGLQGPLPSGRGTVNLNLASKRPLWATTAKDISGKFELNANSGVISGFNEPDFEALLSKGAFFNLAKAANGTFEFSTLDVEARVVNGLAELNHATVKGDDRTIRLSGVIPYRTGSLALAGSLQRAAQQTPAASPSWNFFVGGSWPDPVVSPLSILTDQPN